MRIFTGNYIQLILLYVLMKKQHENIVYTNVVSYDLINTFFGPIDFFFYCLFL